MNRLMNGAVLSCKMGKRKACRSPTVTHHGKRQKRATDGNKKVETWGSSDVCQHLQDNGLEELKKVFHAEQIDGCALLMLTESHLEKIGVEKMGKRLRVLYLVEQLKKVDKVPVMSKPIPASQFKVFNDPIHGHIEIHPLFIKIIDTPQFQRLRYLKQLGGCYYVFPGACHNRFEHCVGVCHLAGQLTEAIRDRQPELGITDQDVLCVRIAGLCHDLGHGPFSHVFDGKFMSMVNPDKKWTHEDASVKMFDHLVEVNDLMPEFEKYGLNKRDLVFIKEQIAGPPQDASCFGKWRYSGRDKDKSFLYEVVANKRNGIDVDKWDYFARDCHHLGISSNFDHRRFMKFARVLEVEGQMQICNRDKEVGTLYDMFYMRNLLHRRAYQHKNKVLIEEMITEALLKANDHIFIRGKHGQQVKLSEAVDDMVAYTKLTDHIFQQILYSENPKLADSQDILMKIQRRQLYKCVGQSKPKAQTVLAKSLAERRKLQEEMVNAVSKEELADKDCEPLEAEDVIIQIINMDYGMKNENPIDHVRFYMKDVPTKAIKVRRDQVSHMLPETFFEQHIRAFTKKTDERSVRAAVLCFHAWCKQRDFAEPKGGDLLPFELTPLKNTPNRAATFPGPTPHNKVPFAL